MKSRNLAIALSVVLLTMLPAAAPCLDEAGLAAMENAICENYAEGKALYDAGKFGESIAAFKRSFDFETAYGGNRSALIDALRESGAYYPFLNSYLFAGRALVEIGSVKEALAYYGAVREELPRWTPIYGELDYAYDLLGDSGSRIATWDLLVARVKELVVESPYSYSKVPAIAYATIGWLSFLNGDYSRTIQCGKAAAVIIDPDRYQSLLDAGLASQMLGDDVMALWFYARGIEDAELDDKDYLYNGAVHVSTYCVEGRAEKGAGVDPFAWVFRWMLAESWGASDIAVDSLARIPRDSAFKARLGALAESAGLDLGGAYIIAKLYSALGDGNLSMAWLKKAAYGSGPAAIQRIENDPVFSFVKGNANYKEYFNESISSRAPVKQEPAGDDLRIVVQERHHGILSDIAVNADGTLLATSSGDRLVKLWSPEGRLLRNLQAERGIYRIAFDPKGDYLVAGTEDGTIWLWTLDGKKRLAFEKTTLPIAIYKIAVSSDGRYVAASTADGGGLEAEDYAVHLWSSDGHHLRSYLGHGRRINDLGFAGDGNALVSSSEDGQIRVWDLVSGRCLKAFSPIGEGMAIHGFEPMPDGKSILVWGSPAGAALWGLDGQKKREHIALSDDILGFKVASASGIAVVWTADGRALRWDVYGESLDPLSLPPGENVDSIGISQTGDIIAIVSATATMDRLRVIRGDGTPVSAFDLRSPVLVDADVSEDGSRVLSVGTDNRIRLWGGDGSLQGAMGEKDAHYEKVRFGPIASSIVSFAVTDRSTYKTSQWGLDAAGMGSFEFQFGTYAVSGGLEGGTTQQFPATRLFPDGRKALLAMSEVLIVDQKGRVATKIERRAWGSAISPDGSRIALVGMGFAGLWDSSGNLLRTFPASSGDEAGCVCISPDSAAVAIAYGGELRVFSVSGTLLWEASAHNLAITDIAWSPDGSMIATSGADRLIRLWSRAGGPLKTLAGHSNSVLGIKFYRGSNFLFSYSEDSTMGFWNLENDQHAFIATAGDEWIIFTEDGYFDSSRNGGDLVSVVKGLTAYSIDQFAARDNRPDIILQRLGSSDSALIEHYRQQYIRRLQRLGLSEAQLSSDTKSVPRASIVSTRRNGRDLTVGIDLDGAATALKSWNVWVNDVPLFGASGRSLDAVELERSETIRLNPGSNKIEVGCINLKGVESFRAPIYADWDGEVKPRLYFLGFGVSKYKDASLDLHWAAKDALDMADLFKRLAVRGYESVMARAWTDAEVTPAAIAEAKGLLKDARPEDSVVLFISGHGLHDDDQSATYYYLTSGADLGDLPRSAARFEDIEGLLQGIAPRAKLFLMDTCESGEAGQGESIRDALAQRDRWIYNDLVRRSGAVVLSSCRGSEASYEFDDLQNGAFTAAIKDCLSGAGRGADIDRDGSISSRELQIYVAQRVSELVVARLGEDIQHPTVDRDNLEQVVSLPAGM
jgi:WD40 repeat protein